MSLRSMTGFARADEVGHGCRWTWEIRSVNGKNLELRPRLPLGMERLDPAVREHCTRHLARGTVQLTLALSRDAGPNRIRINEEVLEEVLAAMQRVRQKMEVQPPTLDGLLSIRGVVELVESEADNSTGALLDGEILQIFDHALVDLVAMREREGETIGAVLFERLRDIGGLVGEAEASPARTPEAIRARLVEQIATIIEMAPLLDSDRLHQEAVLLATKADIREEIDRLTAHVEATSILLKEGGAVGRRLDFLAQEFGRETNTLCAKANDRSLTAIGLRLKAVVDQLREQIQNLE